MEEQEIVNVLKLANNNEIQFLQEKVDYKSPWESCL